MTHMFLKLNCMIVICLYLSANNIQKFSDLLFADSVEEVEHAALVSVKF